MTAIILAFTLTGVGALAVDTGVLYTERQQAQSGADAAALSVAQTCATSTGCGPASGDPSDWAQDNAKTSMAGVSVTSVCGTSPGLTPCGGGDTAKLPDCPELPNPAPANYVEVHTQADNAVNGFIIHRNEHPASCSRVAWGAPGSLTTIIPFTLGACEFSEATGATGDPATGGTFPSQPVAIALNYSKDATCSGWNGHDFPGGFGWLDSNTNCQATVTVDGWVSVEPGMSNGGACNTQISNAVGSVVYLPVYDCISNNEILCDNRGNGNNANYHIMGLAAFQLDGVNYPSYKGNSGTDDGLSCPGKANACLYGSFVKGLVPVGSIDTTGTSPDLGLTVLQMTG